MSEFVYVFRGPAPSGSSEQRQAHLQKWSDWMKELREQDVVKDWGRPVEYTGKLVKSDGTSEGPYPEKDTVNGFMVVETKDIARAIEISRGCPVFETGGLVEVRPVMKL